MGGGRGGGQVKGYGPFLQIKANFKQTGVSRNVQ